MVTSKYHLLYLFYFKWKKNKELLNLQLLQLLQNICQKNSFASLFTLVISCRNILYTLIVYTLLNMDFSFNLSSYRCYVCNVGQS